MIRAALVLALALVAACGGDDGSFRLKLTWRDGPDQGCPARAADADARCESIPMSCNARARIRIVDAEDPTRALFTQCFDLPAGGDACKLADLAIPDRPIPNRMVKVQVAVWPTDTLLAMPPGSLADDGCPTAAQFRLNGLPDLVNPIPSLGGEAYFDVGHDRIAEVELGCPNIDDLECRDDSVVVEARLYDLGFKPVQPVDVPSLTVRFGAPVAVGDGTWTIGNQQLTALTPSLGGDLTWRLRLDAAPVGVQCLHVLYNEPFTTAALTCFEPLVNSRGVLHARGFVVKSSVVNSVLGSMGRTQFPQAGMVIGLVTDDSDIAVPDAVVTPDPISPIHYPEMGFPPLQRDRTSSLGMFVSLEAPFDAGWSATAAGVDDDGTARGGVVQGHVSVVLVPLATRITPDAGVQIAPVDAGPDAP